MKILKFLLYALLALGVIYLIMCAAGPKKMSTSQSMTMNASASAIFEEISDFSKWSAWSAWHKMDPAMKSTITGNPGEVGHKQAWTSEMSDVGNGSQKFVEVRPNEYIKSEMHLMDENSAPAFSSFTLAPDGEGTKVTWSMDGDTPFMMRGVMLMMNVDKIVGEQFNKGLTDLKAIAEAKPKEEAVSFDIIEIPDQWYVGVMHPNVAMDAITQEMYSKAYEGIGKVITDAKKTPGNSISIAHDYNETAHSMNLEIAIIVDSETKVPAGFTSGKIPAGKAVKYTHNGGYETIADSWGKFMGAAMQSNQPRWSGYEEYITGPWNSQDPAAYVTHLIQPVN